MWKRTRPSRVSVRARSTAATNAAGNSPAHSHMPWPSCDVYISNVPSEWSGSAAARLMMCVNRYWSMKVSPSFKYIATCQGRNTTTSSASPRLIS
jgi:hypothetical protein